jgi:hypothetical protein
MILSVVYVAVIYYLAKAKNGCIAARVLQKL